VDTGFRKRSCATNNLKRDDDSKKSHLALGPCGKVLGDANRAAAVARDKALEPVMIELKHLSTRAAAAEIEHRGLGKMSYQTVARARVRLGLRAVA